MSEENLGPEVVEDRPVVTPGVGEQLRAAREAKALTVGDVAQMLKLGVRQVEAIEADRWSDLPGATLSRGFVRNYARLVGVDGTALMSRLDLALAVPKVKLDLPEVPHSALPQPGGSHRRDYAMALSGVFLVLLAVGIYFLLPNDLSQLRDSLQSGIAALTHKDEPQAAAEPKPSETKPAADEPVLPPGATEQQVLNPQAVAVGDGASAPAPAPVESSPAGNASAPSTPPAPAAPAPVSTTAAAPTPAANAGAAPVAPVPGQVSMHFAFDNDSWIEVKDRNGKIVFSQLNPAKSQKDVEGLPPFTLHIGKAPGVHLIYKGKPVDLTPYIRGDVARLTLE